MKQLLISFLFFLFFNISFGDNEHLQKQDLDSVNYYYYETNNPKTTSSLSKAYIFYKNEANKYISLKDTLQAIRNLRMKAIIEYKLGDYYACETTAVATLNLIKNLPKSDFTTESTVGIYNQLGRIHMELLDYNSSINYYNKALKIAKKQSNVNIIKNNIGLVYIEQQYFEKAERVFLDVYKRSQSFNDKKDIARALDNLGYVQYKLHKPQALQNLTEALNLRLEIEDYDGIYASYKNLSMFYKDHDLVKATFYANEAYEVAKKINSTSYIEDSLSTIVSLSSNDKILKYKQIKDSIAKAKQVAENKYALVKYNYEAQEQIANEQKIQKEKERTNRILFQIIGMSIIFIAVFIIILLKSKHKKDRIQEIYNTETRISKKVHDEVANDVYHIMTKLQSENNFNNKILDDLEHVYLRTRDISKENSIIDVHENYSELLNDLLISYKSDSINVITKNNSNINWDVLSNVKKITLFRVLQELMTNMRKHSKATLVALSFTQIGNKLKIDYKDNGVGCNLVKNNGLNNTETRIATINGTINFESKPDSGFKVQIII